MIDAEKDPEPDLPPLPPTLPEAPPDIYCLALDAASVVIGAVRSNADQSGMVEVSAAIYAEAHDAVGRKTYAKGVLSDYSPPAPAAQPPVVTRLQGRLALLRAGLLDKAEAAVASAGGETAIWYADARDWRRNDPHIVSIAAALGLSDAKVDDLFTAAAAI